MLLMIVAAVAAMQDAEPRREYGPATDRTFAAARDALDGVLLDYPSARFRDVAADEIVVCGKVNSKNRMGAYVGWTNFVVVITTDEASAFVDDDIMMDAFCNDRNRPRSTNYSSRMTQR